MSLSQTISTHALLSLKYLKGVPPLRVTDDIVEVQLGGDWYDLSQLRLKITSDIIATLAANHVPWTWLVANQRHQPAGDEVLEAALSGNITRPGTTAYEFYIHVRKKIPPEEAVVDEIYDLLASITFSLKARRTSEIKQLGIRRFCLWKEDDRVFGAWAAPQPSPIDLGALFRSRAQFLCKHLTEVEQASLTTHFLDCALETIPVLPGFVFVSDWEVDGKYYWELASQTASIEEPAVTAP